MLFHIMAIDREHMDFIDLFLMIQWPESCNKSQPPHSCAPLQSQVAAHRRHAFLRTFRNADVLLLWNVSIKGEQSVPKLSPFWLDVFVGFISHITTSLIGCTLLNDCMVDTACLSSWSNNCWSLRHIQ